MAVRIVGRKKYETVLEESCTVEELLRRLNLREEGYICLRNGVPVTRLDILDQADDVTLMEIFSGGR
ncbi:MAG: MoaD/ThiS family protein [Candidatus Thermoplasmatota archaeon]|jgi:sulfur carrier protein ThiS|nr:MoaD/ThiS family protein [Candidatus Thermoplasmatota archaeon]